MTTKLTEKQRKFVEAYMGQANGNATEAARLAGYKGNDKTLSVVGAENLAKHSIKKAIQDRQAECPLILTRKDRQELLSRIASGEEPERIVKITDDGQRIDAEVPAALRERLKAVDQLNKMSADYTENRNLTSDDGSMTPVQIDYSKFTSEQLDQLEELLNVAASKNS